MKTLRLKRTTLGLALLLFLGLLPGLLCPTTSSGAAGSLIAWGSNSNGQTNVPPDLTNAIAVGAGAVQGMAIRQDGTVSVWGGDSAALTNVPAGLSNVVQVAGRGTHCLALRADGVVVGWGANYYPDTNSPTGQATPPADLANAVGIAAGWAHSVALRYDQTVVAWGCNNSGQTNVPANLGPAIAVAAGDWFSAALRSDGTVVAWGDNSVGQTNVPAGLSNVVAISAQGATVLALKQDGRIVAWGGGSAGQTNVPADLTNAVAIAAGSVFELALWDDGRVAAWGDNGSGEIDGAAGLVQVTALAAGGAHGVALLGDGAPRLTLQPRNQAAWPGARVTFAAKAVGDSPLRFQWIKDGLALSDTTNLSGATTPTLTLTNLTGADAGGYSLVISNLSGVVTSAVATLTILNSAVADSFNPAPNNYVYALAVQADGKILVGGSFTALGGQTRNYFGRLNADGSLDTSFNPGANYLVNSLAVQADGKILVGGNFTTLGGQTRNYIGRLNADGSLDASFNPGANYLVKSLAVQADGKILVGGNFGTLGGQTRNYIGRLNADGSLDTSFNPGADSWTYCVAMQADGRILVGGYFTTLGGQPCNRIGRLNADGSLDTTFNSGADSSVYSLAVQADGKILVGGNFTILGGQSRSCLGRFNADGSLDSSFNPGASSPVYSLAVQTDGRILVGGSFGRLGGQTRFGIGRLNAGGSLDTTFNPGAPGTMYALAVQAEGRILVGGSFSTLGGQSRNNLGRLNNTDPATESLAFDGSTVTWLRWGTGPEASRTTFESSTNGTDWISLGAGARFLGGWQQTGLSLPTNTTIRARGFCVGGQYNGSSWFVETSIGAPVIILQPTNVASFTNTTSGFTVGTAGTRPFAYQWYKNGAAITDATNSSFTIQSSAVGDAGSYQVVVTNGFGAVTSVVATLTILNPVLPDGFNPGVGGVSSPAVYALARQSDGKVLVGGSFTKLAGQTHNYLSRLNADGSLDNAFSAGAASIFANPSVNALALQVDGKILVGGNFSMGYGSGNYFFRVSADGSWDRTFNLAANGAVYCLSVQTDGKILVGGSFSTLDGQQSRRCLGRLNADGSLDTTFNPGATGASSPAVYTFARQSDGKTVVGGNFYTLGGQTHYCIGRLNADGSLDNAFTTGAGGISIPSYPSVYSLAVQADDKILVGGYFTTLGGQSRSYLGRLNADGSVDATFNSGANSPVYSLAVQTDGKILVGGYFTTLGGQSRSYVGRINADGSLDSTFNPGANNYVYSLVVQPDGKVLVGGTFTTLGGQTRNYLGRLSNTELATESLSFDGSTVTWLRGATSPEVWRASFEACTSGTDWTNLSAVARIPGGWQQTGLSLPTNATIRARGFCAGGEYNGSSWFLESSIGAPAITCQPTNTDNFTNTVMGFSLVTVGTPPFAYQWYKNGAPIADATNSSFTIQNSALSDVGSYQVVVTNGFGSVTSAVVTLRILDPPVPDSFNPGANDRVFAFSPQADGKVIVGGFFTTLGGQTHNHIGRLNSDGTLDATFNPGASDAVYALAVQVDGKIVVGGLFTNLAGQPRDCIARLNPDGTLDAAFNPGASDHVRCLVVQSDGKIVVAGNFTTLGGQPRSYLGRLNSDGSLDTGFNPGPNSDVYTLALQPDGKLVVGGGFTTLGGQARQYIGRLNADGSVDLSFNPGAAFLVTSLAMQANGKILVGGSFDSLGGQGRNCIGRLNADGTLDTAFYPWASDEVWCLAVQADGKILVGGIFSALWSVSQTRNCLGRFDPDGTLDPLFNLGAGAFINDGVDALALQADGRILVGGGFGTLGGQPRNYIGRLNNTEPATESLTFTNSTVT